MHKNCFKTNGYDQISTYALMIYKILTLIDDNTEALYSEFFKYLSKMVNMSVQNL